MLNRIRYLPVFFLFFAFATFAYGSRFDGGHCHSVGHYGGSYHGSSYHGGGYRGGCYPGWGYRGGCYRRGCYPDRCYRSPRFAGCGSFCGIGICLDDCYGCCDAPCEEVIEYRTVCGYEPCYGWRNGRYCCWERYVCHRVPVRRFVYY